MSLTGRIYKIIHTESNLVYVGSTFNTTRDRFMKHKQNYTSWLKGKHSEISIYPHFKEHGVDQFRMILIKEYEVIDRLHLQGYEQLWINKLKPINKNNAFCVMNNKAYQVQYRKKNKAKLNEKQREKYYANREQINLNRRETSKQYYESNKEKLSKQAKQRYEANKAILSEKFNCDCGGKYTKTGISQHLKTHKHQQWLSTQN